VKGIKTRNLSFSVPQPVIWWCTRQMADASNDNIAEAADDVVEA
jgi:hypothetical protein